MLKSLWGQLGRERAWEQAANAADQASTLLMESIEASRAAGAVSQRAMPLYRCLAAGSAMVYRVMVSGRPYAGQLREVGLGDRPALVSAYFQLTAQRMWDLSRAYAQDAALAAHVGLDYPGFVGEFLTVTSFPVEMLVNTVNAAEDVFRSAGRGEKPQPVIDKQTFDFLQTVSDGRYLPKHWNAVGIARRSVQEELLAHRRSLVASAVAEVHASAS